MPQKLSKDEYVLTAFAQYHAGPGWANQTVTVIIMNSATRQTRIEMIQPEEMTPEMRTLFAISANVQNQMSHEAEKVLSPKRTKKTG